MPETFVNNSLAVTSTETDLYTAPSTGTAVILSCVVANVDGGSADDLTLKLTNSSNTQLARVASTVPVPADATLECVPNKLVLKNGQKLRVQGAAASGRLTAFVSALEIT